MAITNFYRDPGVVLDNYLNTEESYPYTASTKEGACKSQLVSLDYVYINHFHIMDHPTSEEVKTAL
jgi:hypothetical protein